MPFMQPAGHLHRAESVEFHEHEGHAAVYVNGELADGPGDPDNRYEYLLHGYNIAYYIGKDFLVEPDGTDKIAKTTAEIAQRLKARELNAATAARLRAEAAELQARADRLSPRTY